MSLRSAFGLPDPQSKGADSYMPPPDSEADPFAPNNPRRVKQKKSWEEIQAQTKAIGQKKATAACGVDANATIRATRAQTKHVMEFGDFTREQVRPKVAKADHNDRTKRHYEKLGYSVERVDHYDPRLKRSFDLFGFGDMMATKPGSPALIIQLTSYANLGERIKKILAQPKAKKWLETGNEIEAIGWKKVITGSSFHYEPTVRKVTL